MANFETQNPLTHNMMLQKALLSALWLLLPLAASTAFGQAGEPADAIRAYYDAIKTQDCAAAEKLRPGYSVEKCQNVEEIVSVNTAKAKLVGNVQVMFIDVKARYRQNPDVVKPFNGFVSLKRFGERWVIISSSFRSKLPIDEYVSWAKSEGLIAGPADQTQAEDPPQPAPPSSTPNREKLNKLVEDTVKENVASVGKDSWAGSVPAKRPGKRDKEPVKAPRRAATGGPTHANMWKNNGPRTFGSGAIMQACWPGGRGLRAKRGEKKTRKSGPGARLSRPKRLDPKRQLARLPKRYRRSIRRVDTGGAKVVALTFDIGERNNDFAGYDGQIIDYLRDHNIKATFYMGGKWMATHPERAAQLIADPRFEVGNHAWTHGNMRVLRARAMRGQILYTQAQYELALEDLWSRDCMRKVDRREFYKIPQQIPTFRYPYGTCSQESLGAVNQIGLPAVQRDVVTGDPARRQSVADVHSGAEKTGLQVRDH